MTIARRLIVLLAVPLLTCVGIGLFIRAHSIRIEDHSRFVAESRVLAQLDRHLGSLAFAEAQVVLDEAVRHRGISLKGTATS